MDYVVIQICQYLRLKKPEFEAASHQRARPGQLRLGSPTTEAIIPLEYQGSIECKKFHLIYLLGI